VLLYLGSEVRLEKLVKLFVVVVGEVDAFLLAPVLAVQDQVGVVVEDPLDLDIGILVDTAPLLEELLDAGQPIQPSGIARDDLARLVSSPDRAMQRDQRERQRLPDHLCVRVLDAADRHLTRRQTRTSTHAKILSLILSHARRVRRCSNTWATTTTTTTTGLQEGKWATSP
jgi:hypothetical protein